MTRCLTIYGLQLLPHSTSFFFFSFLSPNLMKLSKHSSIAHLKTVPTINELCSTGRLYISTLQWRLNERDGISNPRPLGCLLGRLLRGRSKKTSKLRVTGLFEGNPPMTGRIPLQRASNAKIVSIWWRHHVFRILSLAQVKITLIPAKKHRLT